MQDEASALLYFPPTQSVQPALLQELGIDGSVHDFTLFFPALHPTQLLLPSEVAWLPLGHVVQEEEPTS